MYRVCHEQTLFKIQDSVNRKLHSMKCQLSKMKEGFYFIMCLSRCKNRTKRYMVVYNLFCKPVYQIQSERTKAIYMHSNKNHEAFLYITNFDLIIVFQMFQALLYFRKRECNSPYQLIVVTADADRTVLVPDFHSPQYHLMWSPATKKWKSGINQKTRTKYNSFKRLFIRVDRCVFFLVGAFSAHLKCESKCTQVLQIIAPNGRLENHSVLFNIA